jgi:hypothetical protein
VPEFVTFPACAYETEANGPGPLGYWFGPYVGDDGMCLCQYPGGCSFEVPNLSPPGMTPDCANCPPQLYESECAAIAEGIPEICRIKKMREQEGGRTVCIYNCPNRGTMPITTIPSGSMCKTTITQT